MNALQYSALAILFVAGSAFAGQVVEFPAGGKTLHGELYVPSGPGPFPAVLYNHGSAPGMLSKQAFDALGPFSLGTAGCSSVPTGEGRVSALRPAPISGMRSSQKRAGASPRVRLPWSAFSQPITLTTSLRSGLAEGTELRERQPHCRGRQLVRRRRGGAWRGARGLLCGNRFRQAARRAGLSRLNYGPS